MRREHSPLHDATINQQALEYVEHIWADPIRRLQIIPGKEAISVLNKQLQEQYNVNLTPTSIIDAMRSDDILCEMIDLIHCIDSFTAQFPALATKPD